MTTDKKYKKLTAKQLRWAEEFALSRDAKAAAIAAGYSSRSAKTRGWQLKQDELVMEYMRDYRDEYWGDRKPELAEVLSILGDIVRDDAAKNGDRVRAASEIAKMCGYNSPERLESEIRVILDGDDEDV